MTMTQEREDGMATILKSVKHCHAHMQCTPGKRKNEVESLRWIKLPVMINDVVVFREREFYSTHEHPSHGIDSEPRIRPMPFATASSTSRDPWGGGSPSCLPTRCSGGASTPHRRKHIIMTELCPSDPSSHCITLNGTDASSLNLSSKARSQFQTAQPELEKSWPGGSRVTFSDPTRPEPSFSARRE